VAAKPFGETMSSSSGDSGLLVANGEFLLHMSFPGKPILVASAPTTACRSPRPGLAPGAGAIVLLRPRLLEPPTWTAARQAQSPEAFLILSHCPDARHFGLHGAEIARRGGDWMPVSSFVAQFSLTLTSQFLAVLLVAARRVLPHSCACSLQQHSTSSRHPNCFDSLAKTSIPPREDFELFNNGAGAVRS
jgi:hypothetical protein